MYRHEVRVVSSHVRVRPNGYPTFSQHAALIAGNFGKVSPSQEVQLISPAISVSLSIQLASLRKKLFCHNTQYELPSFFPSSVYLDICVHLPFDRSLSLCAL